MSKRKRPNIDSVKGRIDQTEEEPEEKAPPARTLSDRARPETMQQVASFAKEVQSQRDEAAKEQEELESNRVVIDEVPDEVAEAYQNDPTFYRGTVADNPDTRKRIEGRCEDMDFADLVLTGRVSQHIPILPGKLEVEYHSLKASENFWVERQAEKEALSDWALRSWMGYARLTLSILSLNGREFAPVHKTDETKIIDEALFRAKFDKIMDLGEKPVEYLLVNLSWFADRVERLSDDDFGQLKNG